MNGAGKSTFVKSLAGTLPLLKGERIAAQQLKVGYFAQHQLDMLDRHSSPLLHMQRIAPQENEQALRSYLGRFGLDRKSTRLNSSHVAISYAVFCLKKKKN